MDPKSENENSVELYRSKDGLVELQVRTDGQSVWLNRQQLSVLFNRDVKTIGKHITNAVTEELAGLRTVAKFATVQLEGSRRVEREIEHYSLDVVISVGYRVKSVEGVHFRRWAAEVLRRYLLDGVVTNDRRLQEIGSLVRILSRASNELVSGIADVLRDYLPGLRLLKEYDQGVIISPAGITPSWKLTIDEARQIIRLVADSFPEDSLFGIERGGSLEAVVEGIYQEFAGFPLYPSVEKKAANLLYLVVKDHPLSDGNKRSAAALFVTFLAKNEILKNEQGEERISNNALAALTLMVAISEPKEKVLMISLLIRMLSPAETVTRLAA